MSRGRKKKLRTKFTWIVRGDWCRTSSLSRNLGSAAVHLEPSGWWRWVVQQWAGKGFRTWEGASLERHRAMEAATTVLQRRIKHALERG